MKAGYAALLSLVVAYSMYQGSGTGTRAELSSGVTLNSTTAPAATYLAKLPRGTESFPTIAGGICSLKVEAGAGAPCEACTAVCPAKGLSDLIQDHFRSEEAADWTYLSSHWNVPRTQRTNIRFVIASLPDPVHTHMALLF